MSEFDLDPTLQQQQPGEAEPNVTSVSLCTPGCVTGPLHCTTNGCNVTNGCSVSK